MASAGVGPCQYCSERVAPCRPGCSSLGTTMGWTACTLHLRQHGSSLRPIGPVHSQPHAVPPTPMLIFWEARFNFSHSAEHLAGKLNTAMDALSRNNLSLFHSLTPQAKAVPSSSPHQLLSLLTDHELHWTSPTWANLFRDSLSRV